VLPASPPAQGFTGPRCSPSVADGKVVTLGLRGTLSCYDAAKGTLLWRKEDFKGSLPRFLTSASPVVADGLCLAPLGGGDNGGVIAYQLASGEEKWRWNGDGASYASPVLMTVDGTKLVIAEMEKRRSGHVVQITTSLIEHANSNVPSVLASLTKGGLSAATKSLAIEYAKAGIRVNAVAPGAANTLTD